MGKLDPIVDAIGVKPYFRDDAVVIYHADCRDILPKIPKGDLVLTDPPYGVGVVYGNSYIDSEEGYWEWFSAALREMQRVGDVVTFTHRVFSLGHIEGWDWIGVWDKPFAAGVRIGNSPILPHWEPIYLFGIHSLGTKRSFTRDVFRYNPCGNGMLRGEVGRAKKRLAPGIKHPTPKPVELYKALALAFSDEGQTILDPFMGSGTTLRAAKDLGRYAIGIEIEEKYCEIAKRRMAQTVMAL